MTEIYERRRLLFFRLLRASDQFEAYVNKKLREYGSNRVRFDVMAALRVNGGSMTPTMIARKVHRSKSSITSVLDTLEQQKFVTRKPSSSERRSIQVSLTNEGEEHLEQYQPEALDLINEAMSCFNLKEIEQLYSLLKIFRDNLGKIMK